MIDFELKIESCTAVRRQNTLTLISENLLESDFSDTAHNSAHVSDVQSLIAKSTLQQFFGYIFFDTR